MIRISVVVRGLEEAEKRLSRERLVKAMDEFLDMSASVVCNEARRLAPVRTGRLAASIQKIKVGDLHYVVGSPLDYALYQEVGTRPHVIYPRSARALRFEVDGIVVFARYVNHPGFPGRRYFAQALEYYASIWPSLAKQAFERVMRG